MMEKEYIVSLKDGVNYDEFWHEMESTTMGSHTVPDRIVDIINERPGSLRSCHYSLNDKEAEKLRNDPRVYSVEVPPQKRDDIQIRTSASQSSNFTKTLSDSGDFVNWGLRRCISSINPYGTLTTVSGDYTYCLDGTGVDVVISDSGIQIDHPEFTDINNSSRVVLINWYTASGLPGTQSPNFYRDYDGHGTHVGGIATGKTYGWAKNCAIYSMKVNGLEGSGDSGSGIPVQDAFDTIKLWHMNKPIDPKTGYKRPTVVNMSWSYISSFSNITGGNYRGTSWVGSTKQPDYGMIGASNLYGSRVSSVDVDLEEMLAAGIIVCHSAGNQFQKVDIATGLDYNNYFVSSLYGNMYYNRGGSPWSSNAINVGSIDSTVYNATTEYKSTFSSAGPGVDIYAPGSNIMSAASNINRFGATSQPYYLNASYQQTNISGTSMSSPQVAGLCALYLGINPFATPAQVKAWLINQSTSVIYSTGLDNDYSDSRSIKGSANCFMYNPINSAITTQLNGSASFNNINLSS